MKCEYTICAVVFGVNKSILELELIDEYKFVLKSLNPRIDNLDKIFDLTDFGLRREYEVARIDENNLDVVCIYKEFEQDCNEDIDICFNIVASETIKSIDNQLRIIRLVNEGNARVKKIAIRMKHGPNGHNYIFTMGESYLTTTDWKVHLDSNSMEKTNYYLRTIKLPLNDDKLNMCHMMYDMSYHCIDAVATIVLIDMLEAIFLTKADKDYKNEALAKRCALYIANDEFELNAIYNNVKNFYKRRNSIIHEGELHMVNLLDVKMLRSYCRRVILKRISDQMEKSDMVEALKERSECVEWKNVNNVLFQDPKLK